jgi:hypothetical protein
MGHDIVRVTEGDPGAAGLLNPLVPGGPSTTDRTRIDDPKVRQLVPITPHEFDCSVRGAVITDEQLPGKRT